MLKCLAASQPDWGYADDLLKEFLPELRSQLNEQLRALDCRVDTQTALVAELQDWFRKRAELHQDYSVKLDKLAKSLHARHKEQKVKREQWNLFSVYNCWQILVNQTKKDARDHSAMADVYLNNIVPRFTQVQEDVQRIYKKCREIGYESHEELLKVLHELHTTMRTYHMYQAEFKSAEGKLQNLEVQKQKLELTNPKEKLEKRKKYKVIEKEIEKRKSKYRDAKLKALKARNEYILSMDSANSSIHKYFVEDLSDIVDCMDFGFHSSMAKALLTQINGQECFKRTLQNGIDDLNKSINNLDSRHDKQRFLEYNNAAFMLPKKFEFQGHKGDEMNQVLVTHPIQEEMEKRYAHLVSRLTNLKTESEEAWKTIETAEKTLLDMINTRDYDIAHYFADEPRIEAKQPESVIVKRKADRQETEEFYLGKFRDYTVGSNLICRLQARYELMRKALGDENQTASSPTPTSLISSRNLAHKPRRRRIGRTPLMGQPRLFGGSLEEYLEATSQEIPLIMKSCIRVINLYGLHHQGIFRVSGSQVEINNFRESFERMEDPLADVSDASDINSIAGVLKLYLRELREPIFPTVYFEQFMEIAQLESKQEFVTKVREVIMSLPRAVFVVMRYLFAFLNHLSEFSDENMMDPYNLAICFGPTLVPIPEDKDQVQYQNLVNELIKNIIIFFEDIFPNDGGPIYEKFISRDSLDLDADMGEAPVEDVDTIDSEPGQSEDDSEILEAVAQFDFTARSPRELSFNKRDIILLYSQVSSDWWKGSFKGKVGLIPDKYILLKIRDEDKDRISDRGSTSEDLPKRRASSSSESNVIGSLHLSETTGSINGESPGASSNRTSQDQNASPLLLEKRIGRMCSSPVPSIASLSSSGGGFDGGTGSSPSEGVGSATPGSNSPNLSGVVPHPQEEITILAHRCETPKIGTNFMREIDPKLSYSSVDSILSILPSPNLSTGKMSRSNLSEPNRMHTSFSEPHHSESPNNFSSSWARPASQSSLSSSSSDEKLSLSSQSTMWDTCMQTKASSGAPDLVMDLPISSLSSSPKEQSTAGTSPRMHSSFRHDMQDSDCLVGNPSASSKSPDMMTMTAAECFAKQNQSTLKKVPVVNKLAVAAISTDAQTQTSSPPVKVSACISTDLPQMLKKESPTKEEAESPSGATIVKTMAVMQPTAQEDLVIEVRAAADMNSSNIVGTPSTPKLTARYLKAVAASGGGAGVAVKPQVRVKPTVMKKPSLPASSDCDTPKIPP